MMKNILTSIIIAFSALLFIQAQPADIGSRYILQPMIINPAYAGNRGVLNIESFYRNQWTGISGSPKSFDIVTDIPILNQRVGIGVELSRETFGVTKETNIRTSYAYRIPLYGGSLSMGLTAGIALTNTAWSDLIVIDKGDELYQTDSKLYGIPNFSLGAYFQRPEYFAGISLPDFLSYKFDLAKNKYILVNKPGNYYYLLNGGYIFSINQQFKLVPSALLILSPNKNIMGDLNVQGSYKEMVVLGMSYRSGRAFSWVLQYNINTQIRIAYTYDLSLGHINQFTYGSHEIMFRYEFKYKVNVSNPLNF